MLNLVSITSHTNSSKAIYKKNKKFSGKRVLHSAVVKIHIHSWIVPPFFFLPIFETLVSKMQNKNFRAFGRISISIRIRSTYLLLDELAKR